VRPRAAEVQALADQATKAPAIRALLAGAIDYAGLFPPAALSMNDAVRNYAAYRDGSDAWALGRFVVPVARLHEFADAAGALLQDTAPKWRLSAVAGSAGADDWQAIETAGALGAVIDALELRVRTPDEIRAASWKVAKSLHVFFEIPIDADPTRLIGAIARVGGKAKARTGGVTPDAFPPAADLARFIVTCARAAVPFKATAGLHHPVRATYSLTYEADSPRGDMFGFLNVLLAAALARAGLGVPDVARLLAERDAHAFRFDADGVQWHNRRLSLRTLADARATLALSFGSCSFTEPIAELEQLGLL
jgi:hypothetical protein